MNRARHVLSTFLLVVVLACAGCGEAGLPPAGKYATISGRVLDAVTNAPIPGATITLLVVLTGTSASDGTFKIANVPTGQLDGSVSAPGYATYQITGESVAAGQSLPLTITLKKR